MTALARPVPDLGRSSTRQLGVIALPATVRVAAGLAGAAVFLWPLLLLLPDALSTEAWSGVVLSAGWSSVWQAGVAATAGVALSIPLGWATARLALPGRTLLRALLTLPIVTPAFGVALGTAWLFDVGWPFLLLANAGFGLAIGVRLSGGAWIGLDPGAAEAARTLGVGDLQLARQHYLPALGPTLAAAWALSFALAVSAFGTAYLLAPDSSPTLPEIASSARPNDALAAGAALLLTVVAGAALVLFARCRPTFRASPGRARPVPLDVLSVRQVLALAIALPLGLFVAVGPLFAVLHGALTIGAAEQATGANLASLVDATSPLGTDPRLALRRSVVLAVIALVIAVPPGFVLAVLIAPLRGWVAAAIEAALLLPFVSSVALATALGASGLDGSSWQLFVHLAIVVPLVVRVVLPAARSRVRVQIEAGTVLGASRWTSWQLFVAPRLGAHLILAVVVAAAWSIGELGATLLLQGVDTASAPAAIALAQGRGTTGADGSAFALAMVILLLVATAFVTIEYRRSPEITEF